MPTNCVLSFEDYIVKTILFEQNQDLLMQTVEKQNNKIPCSPALSREITMLEDGCYLVDLEFEMIVENAQNAAIKLKIEIEGRFSVDGDNDETFIYENATAILFPYLRALVSTITANANLPSLILPPINIAAFFKQQEQIENEASAQN